MCVTRRRLDLGMAKQLSDHRQALAQSKAARGEGVAQIMDAHLFQPGQFADALPGVLQVGEIPARLLSDDHVGITVDLRQGVE